MNDHKCYLEQLDTEINKNYIIENLYYTSIHAYLMIKSENGNFA